MRGRAFHVCMDGGKHGMKQGRFSSVEQGLGLINPQFTSLRCGRILWRGFADLRDLMMGGGMAESFVVLSLAGAFNQNYLGLGRGVQMWWMCMYVWCWGEGGRAEF